MSTVSVETRQEYVYASSAKVTVIVTEVPTRVARDEDDNEVRGFSMGVAMRLDELIAAALERDSTPGAVHRLRF